MYVIEVSSFPEWRAAARLLLAARISPAEVVWGDPRSPLVLSESQTEPVPEPKSESPVTLSRELTKLLEEIAHHREDGCWELMYRLAWRSLSNRALLEDQTDPDVRRALQMARAIQGAAVLERNAGLNV
jgi:uracil-DNA glycosylase